ncbi:MAG: hypothetical protein EA001_15510 [Oscillatoriales cyanobacterium]|nr:MAG: hypothetical protein EA001_15510 [Oscillatoriales cyanobacterium]
MNSSSNFASALGDLERLLGGDRTVSDQLQLGDRGNLVQLVQYELNSRGFEAGQPDGMFGPQTELAVKQAQSAYGLECSDIVDPMTWERLGFLFQN